MSAPKSGLRSRPLPCRRSARSGHPPGAQRHRRRGHGSTWAYGGDSCQSWRSPNRDAADRPAAARSRRVPNIAVAEVARRRTILLIFGLHDREAIRLPEQALLLVAEHAQTVVGEDRLLDRPVGGAQRRKAVLLLHVLGDLQSSHRLDLPLWRAGPHRIGAPDHTVGAQSLDQRAHHGGREARLGDHRPGEDRAQVAIDVADAVLSGNLGEVAQPRQAPGLLPLLDALGGLTTEMAGTRMVDGRRALRPVLVRLAHGTYH